jgi:hypothetical protein
MPDTPDLQRPPAPGSGAADRNAQAIDVGELCGRLCTALGLDPDTHEGFQLTVREGHVPELVAYLLHPHADDGRVTDAWVSALEQVTSRGITHAVLPGQDAQAPAAHDPGPLDYQALPDYVRMEALLCRILPLMAEVINGAYVDSATREWLTAMATLCRTQAVARVNDVVFALFTNPTGDPA